MKVLLLVGAICLGMTQAQDIPEIFPPACSSGGGSAVQHRMWAQDQYPDLPGYQGEAGAIYLCIVEFTPSLNCSADTVFQMTARPLNENDLLPPIFKQVEPFGNPGCEPGVPNDATMHFEIPAGAPKGDVLYTFEIFDPSGIDGDQSNILCLQGVGEII